jgi:hypothetical protein
MKAFVRLTNSATDKEILINVDRIVYFGTSAGYGTDISFGPGVSLHVKEAPEQVSEAIVATFG